MNKKRRSGFRYILAPLLAIVMLAAAISLSDSYNSSTFPEADSAAASATPASELLSVVSAADDEPVSPADSGGLTVTIEKVTRPAAETSVSGSDHAESTLTTSEKTSGTKKTSSSRTTKKTASANAANALHVDEPDYESDYYIVVYIGSQNVLIYEKGEDGGYNKMAKCFICSSGKEGHSTRLGLYSIQRRYRWRLLVGDVYGQYSTGFSPSYLFHSVPYLNEEDPASLDEAEYDKLGQPASKGCIRLCVRDAKWIFENCPDGTQINIVDDYNETQGEPVIPRSSGEKYSGWDPSDPDPESPYNAGNG